MKSFLTKSLFAIAMLGAVSAASPSLAASYRRVTIAVPRAPIDEALPARMTFYVDTRFTTTERNRFVRTVQNLLGRWNQYYVDLDNGNTPALKRCTGRYARFNIAPVWFEGKLANGSVATDVLMDGFTRMIIANGFGRAARAYVMYSTSGTIKGVNASNPDRNSLSVTISRNFLNRTDLSTRIYQGSLFHAWMHREGYRHPSGRYTSYIIGEAPMCVMRNNTNKSSRTPDSRYTRYMN